MDWAPQFAFYNHLAGHSIRTHMEMAMNKIVLDFSAYPLWKHLNQVIF